MQDRGLVTIIHIQEVIYEVSFGTVFFDLEWPWKVNPGHTGFQRPISPNLIKITTVTIDDGRKSYNYEVSFGAVVFDLEWPGEVKSRSGICQRAVTWKPLQIRLNLLLMMARKSWSFIWRHLLWPRAVVPKLGAMAPQGVMGLLPMAHIEKIYFSRIDTEKWILWIFGNFYPLKCNIL